MKGLAEGMKVTYRSEERQKVGNELEGGLIRGQVPQRAARFAALPSPSHHQSKNEPAVYIGRMRVILGKRVASDLPATPRGIEEWG